MLLELIIFIEGNLEIACMACCKVICLLLKDSAIKPDSLSKNRPWRISCLLKDAPAILSKTSCCQHPGIKACSARCFSIPVVSSRLYGLNSRSSADNLDLILASKDGRKLC